MNWEPPAPEDLQPDFSQYEIRGILGRGGMGAVYKGWQRSLERLVAIKILPPTIDGLSDFPERFKREARAMAHLKHPGIVAVHEAGETPSGLLYFVMECVEGTDVQQLLSDRKQLDPGEALRIICEVCDALAYAHARGVIHRDIKPSNIMLDEHGNAKVTDFGLAKSTAPETTLLTVSDVTMGTPDFMAPEALHGVSHVDHRADIYAVGVMLYQTLTGKLPRGKFDPPSRVIPGLDKRLDRIVDRALQPDPGERYASAREMRTAIEPVLGSITRRSSAHIREPSQSFKILALLSAWFRRVIFRKAKELPPSKPLEFEVAPVQVEPKAPTVFTLAPMDSIRRFPEGPIKPPQPATPVTTFSPTGVSSSINQLSGSGPIALFQKMHEHLVQGDLAAARELLAMAAATRHPIAQRLQITLVEIENEISEGSSNRADQILRQITEAYSYELYQRGRKAEQSGASTVNLFCALQCYKEAAELDCSKALFRLGSLHIHGRGVSKDLVAAVAYISRAAEQGYGPALLNLGRLYERGLGVRKNCEKAIHYYEKALAEGEIFAEDRILALRGGRPDTPLRPATPPLVRAESNQIFVSYKREEYNVVGPIV